MYSLPSRLDELDPDKKVHIFLDFDGTITPKDSLKFLLNRKADLRWKAVERKLQSGQLSEKEGLQQAFNFLHISESEALGLVRDHVRLDPYFKAFTEWCSVEKINLTVLSGGFESFIRAILRGAGLGDLKVLANSYAVTPKGTWEVSANRLVKPLCSACNHCKSASLMNLKRENPDVCVVYVGDGHTDICPIQLADFIFAKGYLASYCENVKLAFSSFETFEDILLALMQWRHPDRAPSVFAN